MVGGVCCFRGKESIFPETQFPKGGIPPIWTKENKVITILTPVGGPYWISEHRCT
jgi:hypothetical protein